MSLKVAFWNVQRTTENSPDRKQDIILEFLKMQSPDFFAVCEVGTSFFNILEDEGYKLVDHVLTLAEPRKMGVDLKETQLCLAAFLSSQSGLEIVGVRMMRNPTGEVTQRRAKLKVNVKDAGRPYTIYVVHGNASASGGTATAEEAVLKVENNKSMMQIGDFNHDLNLDDSRLKIFKNNKIKVAQCKDGRGYFVRKTHRRGGEPRFSRC